MSVFIGSISGTSPTKVNKTLERRGIPVKMHKGAGYYYFQSDRPVESIYANNLTAFTTDEIVSHVLDQLERRIGGTTPTQKRCLTREFRKLKHKPWMAQKQKVAIALNVCRIPRKK